jgi:protein translocase SecG subunit
MERILSIVQIIISIVLITAVLLQQKGAGLSGVFGGDGNVYRTKRGFEKVLIYVTVIFAALLAVTSLSLLFV